MFKWIPTWIGLTVGGVLYHVFIGGEWKAVFNQSIDVFFALMVFCFIYRDEAKNHEIPSSIRPRIRRKTPRANAIRCPVAGIDY